MGRFEPWESTGVVFSENVDKNLISEDLRKEFLFRKGWSGGSYMYLLLTEIHGKQKDSKNLKNQGVLIGTILVCFFFGGRLICDSSSF